ncbi:MAG: glycosyltransferase [Chloroflexia bacterium]
MRISLIVTVRNEEETIDELLDSMLRQTRKPDEVVINDCGCTDRTMEIVKRYEQRLPLRTTAGGTNIPQGRNTAIRAARGPLIACTDAGLWLESRWLEEIAAPLEAGRADLVAGFFQADPRSPFEAVLGAVAYPTLAEVRPERFLPAGQSMAFTRDAWEAVGGFPEDLPYCEDLVFARRILAAGYRLAFAPRAVVRFRPRSSLGAFFQQYNRYAYGDGLAGLWPLRHLVRYGSYLTGLFLLGAGTQEPFLWALLSLAAALYWRRYYFRLTSAWHQLSWSWRLLSLGLVPLIRCVGDVAKMVGYPRGVWERWRRRRAVDRALPKPQRESMDR